MAERDIVAAIMRESNFRQLSRIVFNREIEAAYSGIRRAKDKATRKNIWR